MTTAPPNRDYIDQMAAHWLTAEREANPAAYADPSVDFVSMLEIARDRVLKIYDGEVRWSECSAGDKVAWLGRPRQRSIYQAFGRQGRERAKRQDWTTFRGRAFSAGCLIPVQSASPEPTQWNSAHEFGVPNVIAGAQGFIDPKNPSPCRRCGLTREQALIADQRPVLDEFGIRLPEPAEPGPRLRGYRERLWWNYFDTVTLGGKRHPRNFARAFGNANIGDPRRCNLDTGGQLVQDTTMVVMDFYVVPCAPAHEVPWNRIVAQLIIGNKPVTPRLPLAELFMGCALWERPCIIPVRQAFYASLEIDEAPDEPLDLVVHIEGLVTRDIQ